MAIDFPSGPTNNAIYVDSTTGNRYIWNNVYSYWAVYENTISGSVNVDYGLITESITSSQDYGALI